MRKPIFIHIFFILIAFVVYIQGITAQGPDLIWNMILALIAYDAAVLTTISKKQKWLYPLLLVVWLAFYPNTFYMLTDLVHMTWVGALEVDLVVGYAYGCRVVLSVESSHLYRSL